MKQTSVFVTEINFQVRAEKNKLLLMEQSPVLTQMPTRIYVTVYYAVFVMKVLTFRNITMARLTLITFITTDIYSRFYPLLDNQMCSSTAEGAA